MIDVKNMTTNINLRFSGVDGNNQSSMASTSLKGKKNAL